MMPGSSRGPLLLFSLVGLLSTCAQEPDTAGRNTTAVAEKPGTCPKAELEPPSGNCTEECQTDASCEGSQKCCQTGCRTSCQIPNDKPGSCPVLSQPIPPLGVCRDTCKTDSNCEGNQKCCKNGCGNFGCAAPVS
ncbi:waprin-Phi1-like [Python bivittatus]|uniref:Waprin-Phi1-like n=1 Tax=Python bivittatus TaxID=176946 RepID=A0A9F2REL2_PYTBI|nr:waprin-Phi1-like [Python bivittatus]